MPEFGETAGDFVRNLIHSLQEEAERLPSPTAMMESLREFDPTPEGNEPMPDHIDIPDDLRDL